MRFAWKRTNWSTFVHTWRIERLACDIANDIGHESFTALCVLKGGYQFFSELIEKIRQYYRFSSFAKDAGNERKGKQPESAKSQQIKVEFVRIKSYEDDTSTGKVTITGIENLEHLKGCVSANICFVGSVVYFYCHRKWSKWYFINRLFFICFHEIHLETFIAQFLEHFDRRGHYRHGHNDG